MGTNTAPDLTPAVVTQVSDAMLPPAEQVKKRDMMVYQGPDGSISNKLPPLNGNYLFLFKRSPCAE